jgi:hypothetical protein
MYFQLLNLSYRCPLCGVHPVSRMLFIMTVNMYNLKFCLFLCLFHLYGLMLYAGNDFPTFGVVETARGIQIFVSVSPSHLF